MTYEGIEVRLAKMEVKMENILEKQELMNSIAVENLNQVNEKVDVILKKMELTNDYCHQHDLALKEHDSKIKISEKDIGNLQEKYKDDSKIIKGGIITLTVGIILFIIKLGFEVYASVQHIIK